MNKLLLTLFWLISLIIIFFVGKNTGASNSTIISQEVQKSSPQTTNPMTLTVTSDTPECAVSAAKNTEQTTRTTSMASSKNNQDNLAQQSLHTELVDVKRQLAEAQNKLESFYAANPDASHTDQPSQATEEEVSQHLSAPFDSVVLKARGSMVDKFRQLHEEPLDQEWSMVTEQHISDFFITHDLADKVKLDAVTCKQTICEIRGFELENEAWGRVMSDMRAQPWWNFVSSHSTTQNNEEFGMYFYSLISKTVF